MVRRRQEMETSLHRLSEELQSVKARTAVAAQVIGGLQGQTEAALRDTHDVARLLTRASQWRSESRRLGVPYTNSLSFSDPMPLVPNPLLADILTQTERQDTNIGGLQAAPGFTPLIGLLTCRVLVPPNGRMGQQLARHASELEGSLQTGGPADPSMAAGAGDLGARLPVLVRQMQELLIHVAAK